MNPRHDVRTNWRANRDAALRDEASDLLDRLARRGVTVTADGPRLAYEGPAGSVTDADVADLQRLKRPALNVLRTMADLDRVYALDRLPRPERADPVPVFADTLNVRAPLLDAVTTAGRPPLVLPDRRCETVTDWPTFCRHAPAAVLRRVSQWLDVDEAPAPVGSPEDPDDMRVSERVDPA